MDPADISLRESPEPPDAAEVPPAGAAVLSAWPTVSVVAQDLPNAFLVQLRRFATTVTNLFAPAPVREGWVFFFAAVCNRITTCPAKYRYGVLALAIVVTLAEWQQPGSISQPLYLSNAAIGFLCALCLAFGVVAVLDYVEAAKWPWEEDGWVWPWQAWLWQRTAYDLGASTSTQADALTSPLPPGIKSSPPPPTFNSPVAQYMSDIPATKVTAFDSCMPPPTTSKQTMIIPPTPQLPGGLRPVYLPPPAPAHVHKSGILGESPMPPRFKNFSGDGFNKHHEKLRAVADWTGPGNGNSLIEPRNCIPSVPSEKRAVEDYDDKAYHDEWTAKKSKT